MSSSWSSSGSRQRSWSPGTKRSSSRPGSTRLSENINLVITKRIKSADEGRRKSRADKPQERISIQCGRLLSDGSINAALSRTDPSAVDVIKRIADTYKTMVIKNRFNDFLTLYQTEKFHIVSSKRDWEKVSTVFVDEIAHYQLFSFDTESILPPRRERSVHNPHQIVYALLATPTGRTCVFDLRTLARPHTINPNNPLEFVPSIVKRWLRDPAYWVLGTGLRQDEQTLKIRISSAIDTSSIYKDYAGINHTTAAPRIIVFYGAGNKSGLAMQALFGKGEDYKPQSRNEYEEKYGAHAYYCHGRRKWPYWRDYEILYKWRKNLDGTIDAHQQHYLYHDSTTPFSLIYRILLERFARGHDELSPGMSLAELLGAFLDPYVDRSIKLEETEEETDDIFLPGPPFAPGPPEIAAVEVFDHTGRSSDPCPLLAKIPRADTDESVVALGDAATPQSTDSLVVIVPTGNKRTRTVATSTSSEEILPRRKKTRGRKTFPPSTWQPNQRSFLRWEADPFLGPGCSCCGRDHSFSVLKDGRHVVTCITFIHKRQRNLCTYAPCEEKETHLTGRCLLLHHTCSICFTRGHREQDGCLQWTKQQWKDRQEHFEEAADSSNLLKDRRFRWEFGFYAHRPYTPYPFPYASYTEMRERDPREIITELRIFARDGTWPRGTIKRPSVNYTPAPSRHAPLLDLTKKSKDTGLPMEIDLKSQPGPSWAPQLPISPSTTTSNTFKKFSHLSEVKKTYFKKPKLPAAARFSPTTSVQLTNSLAPPATTTSRFASCPTRSAQTKTVKKAQAAPKTGAVTRATAANKKEMTITELPRIPKKTVTASEGSDDNNNEKLDVSNPPRERQAPGPSGETVHLPLPPSLARLLQPAGENNLITPAFNIKQELPASSIETQSSTTRSNSRTWNFENELSFTNAE